ncbi:3-dehydroquinate synthase, partial [Candidatus Saganbacteria bacterium]|nr:3-dehydroquinate synthase [Candidatus Saganbacteria bacterium]
MAKIKVNLPARPVGGKERSYAVVVGKGILPELGGIIENEGWGRDIFVITDPLVNKLYGKTLKRAATFEVPRGERYKSLATAEKLYDRLLRRGAHRDSLIIALGGGVVGDMAGFVAATYMRGINYIQVPTTLLAQVDAALGGKTAVNHPQCKNLIGSFYQPKMVFCDVKTLATLPPREVRTGLAEVVKYGVIANAELFKLLERNTDHLTTIVAESVKIKARVVAKDERETGLRMILNFGHTVGHAIESLTRYQIYNHGEAVAVGMVAASLIACRLKMMGEGEAERIMSLLEKLGLPTAIKKLSAARIVQLLALDKNARGGKVLFVLPEKIGKVVIR